ncbi:hypothetical protein BDW22DRAFT_346726 [Trametopsis cervina]|nr:hypothetical protein BDW22DRAFT_346726 [Trametopsis cervina]
MPRPVTRSSARVSAPESEVREGDDHEDEPESDAHRDEADNPVSVIKTHVSKLLSTVRTFERDYAKLKQRNEELTTQLADATEQMEVEHQPKPGKKGKATSVAQLQKQVVELKAKVRELDRARARDKRKIAKLQAKEVRRDVMDLEDQTEFEIGDSMKIMRKLMHKFYDLMLANSLEGTEECAICMSTMQVGDATSLPCEHVFCADCISQVASTTTDEDDSTFPCPTCRTRTRMDDTEVIEYTAAMQWDALLEVAKASAKLDRRRGELDTSEEEAEEYARETFIDDEESEDASSDVLPTVRVAQASDDVHSDTSVSDRNHRRQPIAKRRRLRAQTPSSEHEEPVASGSATDSTLTNLEGEDAQSEINKTAPAETVAGPSTPLHPPAAGPSYLHSPASEKRRRMEELADARQAKVQLRVRLRMQNFIRSC